MSEEKPGSGSTSENFRAEAWARERIVLLCEQGEEMAVTFGSGDGGHSALPLGHRSSVGWI